MKRIFTINKTHLDDELVCCSFLGDTIVCCCCCVVLLLLGVSDGGNRNSVLSSSVSSPLSTHFPTTDGAPPFNQRLHTHTAPEASIAGS